MQKHYAVIGKNFTLYTKAVNKEKEGQKALDDYKNALKE